MARKEHDIALYKNIYDKHMNLKIAASELGMKWQTLYWHLSRADHPVIGDKERYGSSTDKLADYTEKLFHDIVPEATNNNENKFQAKLDFEVNGYNIDVKASTKKDGYKNNPTRNASLRWAFSCKVQEQVADFMVCYCFSGTDCIEHGEVEKILLIPKEMFKNKQSLSVSCKGSKWYDFEVTEEELRDFLLS